MSNRARTQFECDGVAFDVGRLNLNDSCKGLELLAKVMGPAICEAPKGQQAATMALLGQAGQIPALLALFAPVAKFWRGPDGEPSSQGNGTLVDLKPFVEQAFATRLELACAFLAECVKNEFGPFIKSVSTGALAQTLTQTPAAG